MDWNQDGYTFCTEIRCSLVKSHVSIRDNIQSIINLRGTEARYYSDITYGRWVAVRSTNAREENSKENDRRNAYLVPVCLVGLLRKSRYPEDFGSLQKTAKGTLMHVHFPVIDELHQSVQIAERYVLKYYHRVFTRCALQKGKQEGKEETFSCNGYTLTLHSIHRWYGDNKECRVTRWIGAKSRNTESDTMSMSYLEQFSKIGTACGKYDAVRFEAFAIAGQCDVHKIFIVP